MIFRVRHPLRFAIALLLSILVSTRVGVARAESPENTDPSAQGESSEAHDAGPDMLRPLLGIDVSPGNDFAPFAPQWMRTSEGRTLGFGFGIDKMLSEKVDIEVESAMNSFKSREGSKELGFDAVDAVSRYMIVNQPDVQVSVAPHLTIDTGSFGDHVGLGSAGFAAMFGGRGGALPDGWNLGFLRAIEVHSDLGYSRITQDGTGNEVFFDPMLDYSFPYLEYLTKSQLPWPLRKLCVFGELNFDEVIDGTEHGAPTLYETSGIGYVSEAYQVSAGVQLPLNHAGERAQQIAIMGEIEFALDDVPVFGWMPL